MHFIDGNTGWITNRTYIVYPHYTEYFWGLYKSINGGNSWSGVTGGSLGTFFVTEPSVYFYNVNIGFFYTPSNNLQVYRTTNSGANWNSYDAGVFGLRDYHFSTPDTGWICGNRVKKSTDGGITWITQLDVSVQNMYFLSSTIGWIVGNNGSIYKTVTGGVTQVIPISSEIPNSFALKQNYPNPFNPSTKIRFDIPHSKNVKLSVFNSLGQQVAVLVNEQLQPGIYEYEFIASDYSSGIYFYRIDAEDFSEAKRMVLIK